jgi:hypothetical protein
MSKTLETENKILDYIKEKPRTMSQSADAFQLAP